MCIQRHSCCWLSHDLTLKQIKCLGLTFFTFYLGRCFNWKFRNTFSIILSILACLSQKIIQFFSNIILQDWQRCLVFLCRIPSNLSGCCVCCCCSNYIFKLFLINFTKQKTALLMELWNLSTKDNQLEKNETSEKNWEKELWYLKSTFYTTGSLHANSEMTGRTWLRGLSWDNFNGFV